MEGRHERLAAAMPEPLAQKVRAAPYSGERKIVTVLFADVVGSTSIAEQIDPEEWAWIINSAFDRLMPPIYRYEGTIAQLLGDGFLAFFGAPIAHEDDPVRAVRAGLDLIAACRDFARDPEHGQGPGLLPPGASFEIRVGVNTGLVVVGEVGTDLKYEYLAVGDAVNLAARMQAAASPMSVLISENTFRFVRPFFESVALGPIAVRGKAEPVEAYEVRGLAAQPGTLRGLAGLDSPMIGRDADLAALLSMVAGLANGAGGAALVLGEAGLGKSRLVSELRARSAEHTPVPRWAVGQCLSYGRAMPYHAVTDLLRSLLGAPSGRSEGGEAATTLAHLTDRLFGERAVEVHPYLGHLLGLALDNRARGRVEAVSAESLQGLYVAALRMLVMAMAEEQPLVLCVEDVHWADPASVDVLSALLPLAMENPILFCLTGRPDEDAPGARLIASARETLTGFLIEVSLDSLAPSDSSRLVENLLDMDELPEGLRSLIEEKAEGNPLFVEELIRTLVDRGALRQGPDGWRVEGDLEAVEIPDTLQGLLLARIDRLPDELKRTIRVASVIGRQFSVPLLGRVLS